MLKNFFDNLSNKERKILYIAVPLVLLALYDRLLIAQALESLRVLDEKIVQQEHSIKADLRYLQHRDKLISENNAYSKYISTEKIENKDVNKNFLSTVENMASQANINIVKSNPTDAMEEGNFTKYFANIDCSGTFKDMISFMHTINSTDDLLKVVRYKLTPKRGDVESSVNASMTISKLFVQPDGMESSEDSESSGK